MRQLRLERRKTQAEFAELLHVSTDLVSQVERGINAPSFKLLEIISAKLELTLPELFTFTEYEDGPKKRVRKRKLPGKKKKPKGKR